MKEQTAMQKYKEWLKHFYESFPMIGDAAYNSMQSKATELLEEEKKQLIDARLSVTGLNHASPTDDTNFQDAENFYNQKYKL